MRPWRPTRCATSRRRGALAGSEQAQDWARQANTVAPALRTHDRFGNRIDEVDFHPAWHSLLRVAVEHGLHAATWILPASGTVHLTRAAGFFVWSQAASFEALLGADERSVPRAGAGAGRALLLPGATGVAGRDRRPVPVEFDATLGWLVGAEGRGLASILEMVTLTRLDCVIGSAATQPLMREVLADLALESRGGHRAVRAARHVRRSR